MVVEIHEDDREYNKILIENIVNETVSILQDKLIMLINESVKEVIVISKEYTDNQFKSMKDHCALMRERYKLNDLFSDKEHVESLYSIIKNGKNIVKKENTYKWIIGLLATSMISLIGYIISKIWKGN